MKIKLDEQGKALADVEMYAFAEKALAEQQDVHVANILTIDYLRLHLVRMPIENRPQVEWEFYGKPVHFDEKLRSFDAWDDERTDSVRVLVELL